MNCYKEFLIRSKQHRAEGSNLFKGSEELPLKIYFQKCMKSFALFSEILSQLTIRPELFYEVCGVTVKKFWWGFWVKLVDDNLMRDLPVQALHVADSEDAHKVDELRKNGCSAYIYMETLGFFIFQGPRTLWCFKKFFIGNIAFDVIQYVS